MNPEKLSPQNTDLIMYQTEDGVTRIEVRLENETVWLTQAQLAELFQRDRSVITKHIRNIFSEGELDEKSNVQKMHIAFYKKTAGLLAQPLTYSFLCNCSSGQIFASMSQHNLHDPHRRI